MGSDPEFSFVIQDRRIHASELLSMNLSKKKGFKREDQGYACAGGQLGWDGCSATAEVRPKPAETPREATDNIKNILESTHQYLKMFDMSTLSTYAPVGGHFHFQISEELHDNPKKLAIIHKKVSSFFLPIMISENKISLRLRTKGNGYGTLTDYHGDNRYSRPDGGYDYTYEFRTPSAEWLTTEKICEATHAYLGVVFNEIINEPKNFARFSDIIYKNNEQAKALHQLAITDYIGVTESLFNRIKKAVRSFKLYPEYKAQIEYILNPQKVMADKKKAEYNIAKGWGFVKKADTKVPNIKEILNRKKFLEKASKLDLDKMAAMMNISFNDDTNVNLFVRSLSEKAAVFNWKLENNYFIFGLRKGIDETLVFDQNGKIIIGGNIIKTVSDQSAMEELTGRIIRKFISGKPRSIDPTTGEIKKVKTTIIGLPYDMRVQKKCDQFVRLVYKLEKTKNLAGKEISYKDLTDDLNVPEEQRSNFYKMIFDIKEPEDGLIGKVPYDEGSQGARIATDNTRIVIHEEIRDAVENSDNPSPEDLEYMRRN